MDCPVYHSVGFFPPPWCGVSFVNDSVRRHAEKNGLKASVFNTAGRGLDPSFFTRLTRLRSVLQSLIAFVFRRNRSSSVYISSSGGYAIIYETAFSCLARMSGAKQVIHHHSYRYINQWFWPMALLQKLAGHDAWHVLLSESMAARFASQYGPTQSICLTNSVFLEDKSASCPKRRKAQFTIGLLSNLSTDKGVADFLNVAALARTAGQRWHFRLAGPFATPECEIFCRSTADHIGGVEIAGPLLDGAKRAFYESLDAFLFPTRYINEAEPLVVLEALNYGVPVIAFGRGAIPEILGRCGTVVPPSADFVPTAYRQLLEWDTNRSLHLEERQAAYTVFKDLREEGQTGLTHLMSVLQGSTKNNTLS